MQYKNIARNSHLDSSCPNFPQALHLCWYRGVRRRRSRAAPGSGGCLGPHRCSTLVIHTTGSNPCRCRSPSCPSLSSSSLAVLNSRSSLAFLDSCTRRASWQSSPLRLPVSSPSSSYSRRRNVGRDIFPRALSEVANAGEFVSYGSENCIVLTFNHIAKVPPIQVSDLSLMDVLLLVTLF